MNPDFETALEESITLLRSGSSVEECLQRFPQYAGELRPLLETAAAISAVRLPAPSPEVMRRSRERMFREADKQFAQQAVPISPFSRYVGRFFNLLTGKETLNMKTTTRLAFTVAILALFIVSGLGVNLVSANALPGDALYPAKRFFEKARLTFTVNPQTRVQVERQLQERRREEVRTVLEMQRQVDVEFSGELMAFDNETWTVGGFTLQLNARTEIQGAPQIGVMVSARAAVGKDGVLQAESLVVSPLNQPAAYPGPENTAPAMPSQTPMPTHTQMASETPEWTHTPMSSHTPEPSETWEPPHETPEHTSEPSETWEPSETPEQEHTPMPSATWEPSETPEWTHTPMPSHTPEPSETWEPPHETPEHTPEPSETWEPPHETPEHTPMPTGMPHP